MYVVLHGDRRRRMAKVSAHGFDLPCVPNLPGREAMPETMRSERPSQCPFGHCGDRGRDIRSIELLIAGRLEQVRRSLETRDDVIVEGTGDPDGSLLVALPSDIDQNPLALDLAVGEADTGEF